VAPNAWIEGVKSREFRTLIDAKQRSIVPMVVIYVVGDMGLSILADFGRGILGMKALRAVNLGLGRSNLSSATAMVGLVLAVTAMLSCHLKSQIPANQFSPCLLQNVSRKVLVTSIALIHLAFL